MGVGLEVRVGLGVGVEVGVGVAVGADVAVLAPDTTATDPVPLPPSPHAAKISAPPVAINTLRIATSSLETGATLEECS